jgi:hypothetical protein
VIKKSLVLIPFGGLANRMYAITSAIGFCEDNNIKLKIIWFKDWGMGARFHHLFELSPSVKNVEIIDAKWYDYLYDRPRRRNLWVPYLYQKMRFDSLFYEKDLGCIPFDQWFNTQKNKSAYYAVHCWKFYAKEDILNRLCVVNDLQIRINNQLNHLSLHTIGIHIRRTDNVKSITESPFFLFVEKIKEEIAKEPASNFYIASDSEDEKRKLTDMFGDKIITQNKVVRRDTKEGIMDALIELYTLASTNKIYGSSGSTYSYLASEINNIPLDILVVK